MIPVSFVAAALLVASGPDRGIPVPRPGHPGNIFVKSERVIVDLPDAGGWKLYDYENKAISTVSPGTSHADLGPLPVGYYLLKHTGQGSSHSVTLAVLEHLKAATPTDSPICIDAAMAWFYKGEQIRSAASLCALAGINRVRDRLTWGEVEPERGQYAHDTRFDFSIAAQTASGLQVLDVHHASPAWANPDWQRFPLDLRDAYNFCKTVASRWNGQIAAYEPWNEANISGFGGQTGSEMAALQKASYLGLKAGNPDIIACLNVWATHVQGQLRDFEDNAAWPYFDTYNLHHYEPFEAYPGLYADHRAVSAGRPMWVTEAALPVNWTGDPSLAEPSDSDLKVQSERIAKVYACAIHEGVEAAYYFILGHYIEGQTQFGIIRQDLTPRPAFVALAAAGRLLAGAKAMGCVKTGKGVHSYVFRTRTDGREQFALVAWSDAAPVSFTLPLAPTAVYDHLGRSIPASSAVTLSQAPTFALLSRGCVAAMDIIPPPARPQRLVGTAYPVVIQVVFPADRVALFQSAYRYTADMPTGAKLYVYNFGKTPVSGSISASNPDRWTVGGLKLVQIEPMGRAELLVQFHAGKLAPDGFESILLSGDFGAAGRPVASIRLTPDASDLAARAGVAVNGAEDPANWELMVANGPAPTAIKTSDGIVFEASPTGDAWFYPRIKTLSSPPPNCLGVACTITVLDGKGQFRMIFDEKNGSSYVADALITPVTGKAIKTLALFADSAHGDGWSAPDPKGAIDPNSFISMKIGVNGTGGKLRFRISDVRWIATQ